MSEDNGSRDPEEIRAQIDHTRDELADTVQALAAKTDVKGRAAGKAHEVQETAKARVQTLQATAKERAHDLQETAKVQAAVVTEQAKALGEQARVKGEQARVAATERAHTAQETVQQQRQEKPWLLPALGGAAGLLAALFVWLRRRRTN